MWQNGGVFRGHNGTINIALKINNDSNSIVDDSLFAGALSALQATRLNDSDLFYKLTFPKSPYTYGMISLN